MHKKTISEIESIYDLELERIIKTIQKEKAKRILLQFPDGMKPYSLTIANEIEEKTKAKCFIWLGTCFGACDIPLEVEKQGIDLIIQFGHSPWNYKSFNKNLKILK
ncbi:MAG: diphthamide synthesis protein [Candidatus Pacearchaeota archaeon]